MEDRVVASRRDLKRKRERRSLQDMLPFRADASSPKPDWRDIIDRCRSRPDEATVDYEEGEDQYVEYPTALHLLVKRNPPLEAVVAATRAYPAALTRFAETGSGFSDQGTPLSLACKSGRASAQVVLYLLRSHVAEMSRTGRSGNPLDFVIDEDVSVGIFRLLLRNYPQGATSPYEHGPDCMWENPLDELLQTFIGAGNHGPVRYGDWTAARQASMWAKLQLVLVVNEYGPSDHVMGGSFWSWPSSQLHSLFRYLRNTFDEDNYYGEYLTSDTAGSLVIILSETYRRDRAQFYARDENGQMPLHALLSQEWRGEPDCPHARRIVKLLLAGCPKAARTRSVNDGDIPFHMAARNNWPYQDLLRVTPRALQTRCQTTRLYPFQLAAVGHGAQTGDDATSSIRSEMDVLNVAYDLLRSDPSLI